MSFDASLPPTAARPGEAPAGGARELTPAQARAIADALVRRHARAPRAPDLAPTPADHAHRLARLAESGRSLPADLRAGFEAALARQHDFLAANADRLLARAGGDRILAAASRLGLEQLRWSPDGLASFVDVEAGGDLAPQDAVFELAQLSLALVLRDRVDLAERLVSQYAGQAEDFDLYPVLAFYEDLCALESDVSAAVRSSAEAGSSVRLEARLAALEPARRRAPPLVVAMSGQVASGKSSLARALADELGAPRTEADRIRDHLVHGVPGRPVHEVGWAEGFEPGFGPRVYSELLRRGEIVLSTGRSVVLDACFPTPRERAAAASLARRHGAEFRFVECRVDPDVQRERLAARDASGESDGWSAIAESFAERFVAPEELPRSLRLRVDTSGRLEDALASLMAALPAAVAEPDV